MGAILKLNEKRYELQYEMFYKEYKLKLKVDTISIADAERYISKLNHRKHMKHILSIAK